MHFSSILLTFGNTAAAMIRYLEFDALQLNNGGTSHLSNSDTCVLLSYFPFILQIHGQKARCLKANKSVKIPASYSGMFSQTLIPMSAHTWFSGYLSGRQFHLCRPADDRRRDRLGRDSNSANSANLPKGQCAPDTMLAERRRKMGNGQNKKGPYLSQPNIARKVSNKVIC